MAGYLILVEQGAAGWRDFLNAKPVHCGDQLQLWDGEKWVYARYEVADRQKQEVFLYGADRTWVLKRRVMFLRWPPQS